MKVGNEEKEGFEISDFKGKFGALKKLVNGITEGGNFKDDDDVECTMHLQRRIKKDKDKK